MSKLSLYNTLTKKKEVFKPMRSPFVGMYVCGPTVYGDAHLGHARPAITFDIIFRHLLSLGYKVRYVRNITDVGHLENDSDEGEDKIGKKARLEQVEPMEIVQFYTDRYHDNMRELNVERPSIEPKASGHIIEQIGLIEEILKNGFAYIVNGSVYFDVKKYSKTNDYGKLSGRVLEDLIGSTRELTSQDEKKNSVDFALWKKADVKHIMRWPSPWSDGFPGWHLECSVMSSKYLGERFDIHGGGLDLLFPHHECEIAQSRAAYQKDPANYWIHNNMITINGQKMGKSLGNFITLNDLFAGNHELLSQAFDPMTIRFFVLQAHYRGTLDFSNDALVAAEKGFARLSKAYYLISKLKPSAKSTLNIDKINLACEEAMNDDFNTPIVIANLFDAVKIINSVAAEKEAATAEDIEKLKSLFETFAVKTLGIRFEESSNNSEVLDDVMQVLINLRNDAKSNKDFATSDTIRDLLLDKGVVLKDTKDGTLWVYEEK